MFRLVFISRFSTPFASRDYRQQHRPQTGSGISVQGNPVVFNPVSTPAQPAYVYGGYGGFYGAGTYQAPPQATGQAEWWTGK